MMSSVSQANDEQAKHWNGTGGRAWPKADAKTRAALIAAVRPAFDPYVQKSEVRYTAACWIVHASASRHLR